MAVDPVEPFRQAGKKLHGSKSINWIDDTLPLLSSLPLSAGCFDVALLVGVWQHIQRQDRDQAAKTLASLDKPHGLVIMSVRHGPEAASRPVYHGEPEEVIALAKSHGLELLFEREVGSIQDVNENAGVTWTWLVLQRH